MPVTARLDPLDRDIALMIAADLSPEAQASAFADMARGALADAEAQNSAALGYPPSHDTLVDGAMSSDAALDRIRPGGTIAFRFKLLDEVLTWIDAVLIGASPVRSGRYARSHLLFADDVETDPLKPASAREYAFVNAQPYARKIERGLSPMAPQGVYEGVAVMAAQRFGNVARIKFSFRSLPGGAVGAWAKKTRLRSRQAIRNRPGARRIDWLTRQPAIIVTP